MGACMSNDFLWTDEKIDSQVEFVEYEYADSGAFIVDVADALRMMREMRDEWATDRARLQQQCAELEAQLAEAKCDVYHYCDRLPKCVDLSSEDIEAAEALRATKIAEFVRKRDTTMRLCEAVTVEVEAAPSVLLTPELYEFIRHALIDQYGTPWAFTNGDTEALYKKSMAWLAQQQ